MTINAVSLNARGLNKSIKRRKLFRWLHIRKFDVIFLRTARLAWKIFGEQNGEATFSLRTAQNIAEVLWFFSDPR